MNNKINNVNTEEMKEDKTMQEVSTENLENVAGGNSYTDKIKRDVQSSVMTQKEKDEIDSLLREYRFRNMTLAYGGIDILHPRPFDPRRKKEPVKRETTEDKLKSYAKRYPNYPGLEQFAEQNK